MTPVLEHLPRKWKALSSNPSTANKKRINNGINDHKTFNLFSEGSDKHTHTHTHRENAVGAKCL
jgi:hypothetical protein